MMKTRNGNRLQLLRAVLPGLVAGLTLLLTGDRTARMASYEGIDPIEILTTQVKPNVLFLIDTTASMKWIVDQDNVPVGADDERGRLRLVKDALSTTLSGYSGRANFGMAFYGLGNDFSGSELVSSESLDDETALPDGPIIYVSTDANAAYWHPGVGTVNGGAGFDDLSNVPAIYGSPGNVFFQAFKTDGAYASPFPAGCTPGTDCRYYMQSRQLRGRQRVYTWDTSTAPPTLSSNVVDTTLPSNCIQFIDSSGGNAANYCYTSGLFQGSGSFCGATSRVSVPSCATNTVSTIQTDLRRELLLDANGYPDGVSTYPTVIAGTSPSTTGGLRADQEGDLAGALDDADGLLPTPSSGQKNFIVVLTDSFSDASLNDVASPADCADDPATKAANAASKAAAIWDDGKGAEVHVIALGASGERNVTRANQINRAGTGGKVVSGVYTCVSGASTFPSATPPPYGVYVTCQDARTPSSSTELSSALDSVMDRVLTVGEFSASEPVTATVFELGQDSNDDYTALDPRIRYDNRVNIFYQSTFELPGWHGHLRGYQNDGTFLSISDSSNTDCSGASDDPHCSFDAGLALFERTSQALEQQVSAASGEQDRFTFAELHAGTTVRDIDTTTADGLLKRRIFTSSPVAGSPGSGASRWNRHYESQRNAADDDTWDASSDTGSNVVALWPPNQNGLSNSLSSDDAVDPAFDGTDNTTWTGALDTELELSSLTSAELTTLGACVGVDASLTSHPCNDADSSIVAAYKTKEAREILLAYLAGARVARINDATANPQRASDGSLLFRERGWLLPDTTLSTLAVSTPPLRATPGTHSQEWVLYRDGRRDSNNEGIPEEIHKGFGLRNPDFDNGSPADDLDTKPIMTVIYIGSNQGLHAFRAGPSYPGCPSASGAPADCEEGGEELWMFVPIDRLGLVKSWVLDGQRRDPHLYGVASSVRLADIFIPSAFTITNANGDTVSFAGRWRAVVYFGRGPGSKFYTALDVTAPGPFTTRSLATNPPFVLWNRGNDGTETALSGLGHTWSVPAVGRTSAGSPDEWQVWTGSGYDPNANGLNREGTTFYSLNAYTGNVILGQNIGTVSGAAFKNALVAGPSAFNPYQLDNPTAASRSTDRVTRVFIPDIQGRIWKFTTSSGGLFANAGTTQPIADSLALMKIDVSGGGTYGYVFGVSGNDSRVSLSSNTFEMFALQDSAGDDAFPASLSTAQVTYSSIPLLDTTNTTGTVGTAGFRRQLVDPSNTSNRYRGNAQPATAFDGSGNARVFFVGYRPRVVDTCRTTFDTILFALGGLSGGAAYDFGSGAQLSTVLADMKSTGVQVSAGQVIAGSSGTEGTAPGPPPVSASPPSPSAPEPASITVTGVHFGTAICD